MSLEIHPQLRPVEDISAFLDPNKAVTMESVNELIAKKDEIEALIEESVAFLNTGEAGKVARYQSDNSGHQQGYSTY